MTDDCFVRGGKIEMAERSTILSLTDELIIYRQKTRLLCHG
jgi:hypothetical protein